MISMDYAGMRYALCCDSYKRVDGGGSIVLYHSMYMVIDILHILHSASSQKLLLVTAPASCPRMAFLPH